MTCGHVNESDDSTVAHPNRLNIFQWAIRICALVNPMLRCINEASDNY